MKKLVQSYEIACIITILHRMDSGAFQIWGDDFVKNADSYEKFADYIIFSRSQYSFFWRSDLR